MELLLLNAWYLGSYLIHLFGVRFLLWTGEFQSSIREQLCRSCSEYTTFRGGVVGVDRSRDQTKMAERLNGIKTNTNISFKTRNSYRISASCFESLSEIVSEYDQEIPQSQTADNPMAPGGRAAQPPRDTRKTKKAKQPALSSPSR